MASRMDRYENNITKTTRSSKYQKVYENISNSSYLNYEKLPVSSNVNEIDITTLKKIATNRDEYRKIKELEDTMLIKKQKIKEDNIELPKEKIRDINELIAKARSEKEKLITVQKKISNTQYNFLNNLKENEDYEKIEEAKQQELDKLQMTRQFKYQTKTISKNPTIEQIISDTAQLSLDILSDLKPSENTIITKPIKETKPQEEKEEDFYSNTYKFSKKDFFTDDELKPEKTNLGWKIFVIILTIIIIVLTIIYALNYFDVDVISFLK